MKAKAPVLKTILTKLTLALHKRDFLLVDMILFAILAAIAAGIILMVKTVAGKPG